MYVRYNSDTQSIVGRTYSQPYSVDGEPAELPAPLVELELVEQEQPEVPEGKMLQRTQVADLDAKTYTRGWALVDLPPQMAKAQAFQAAKDAGFTLQPEGWVLGLQDVDRVQFDQLWGMLQNLESQGALTENDQTVIHDKDGNPHPVTVKRYREILADYGMAFYQLWMQHA